MALDSGTRLVFVLAALAIPSFAHAECVALWKTARDAQRLSTLVFSGTVIKTDGQAAALPGWVP